MKKFPDVIPVFPLSGVIYFPKTNLPLNIFEQRYVNLVNDAYNKDKLMGMVQSKKEGNDVYDIGCLGKISDYKKEQKELRRKSKKEERGLVRKTIDKILNK